MFQPKLPYGVKWCSPRVGNELALNICPFTAEAVNVISHEHSLSAHCSGLEDVGFFSPIASVSLELSQCQVILFPG